jgi:hypothetical protein
MEDVGTYAYACRHPLTLAIEEELVDYYDWMVDDECPGGITITDEMEFISQHPEVRNKLSPSYFSFSCLL